MPDGEKGINKNRFVNMGKKESRNGERAQNTKGLVVQIPCGSRVHIFGSRKKHSGLW